MASALIASSGHLTELENQFTVTAEEGAPKELPNCSYSNYWSRCSITCKADQTAVCRPTPGYGTIAQCFCEK